MQIPVVCYNNTKLYGCEKSCNSKSRGFQNGNRPVHGLNGSRMIRMDYKRPGPRGPSCFMPRVSTVVDMSSNGLWTDTWPEDQNGITIAKDSSKEQAAAGLFSETKRAVTNTDPYIRWGTANNEHINRNIFQSHKSNHVSWCFLLVNHPFAHALQQ